MKNDPNFVSEVCVWGPPEQCAEGLQAIQAAGAEMIVLNPIRDYVPQLERLSDEVTPYLRVSDTKD